MLAAAFEDCKGRHCSRPLSLTLFSESLYLFYFFLHLFISSALCMCLGPYFFTCKDMCLTGLGPILMTSL